MMHRGFFLLIFLSAGPALLSMADMNLETAGTSKAPLEISKESLRDPTLPLTKDQRKSFVSEFKGLVYMGLEKASYERWQGRSMSDCVSAEQSPKNAPGWEYKCELITGQGGGNYFFYPSENRRRCTLQRIDIHLDAADARLVDDLRASLQALLGRGVPTFKNQRPGRHWDTGEEVADLFIDSSDPRAPEAVRFVWNRSAQAASSQAKL